MRGVNKVILIGNLGKDPDLRYTPNGQSVASFPLATSSRWKDKNDEWQDKTEWHNIVIWGRQAEVCNEYLKKGSPVYIEGRIQYRSYEDKDGNKRYVTEIVAQQMRLLGRKGEEAPEEPKESTEEETIPEPEEGEDLPF